MGQGYSFFAVIVFVVSGFVPAWLKKMYITGIFSFKTPLSQLQINAPVYLVTHRQINAPVYLLNTGKLMPQCIC